MRIAVISGLALVSLAASGCVMREVRSASAAGEQPQAQASIARANGDVVATAEFFQVTPTRIRVEIDVNALPPGRYGVHIHQVGRCDGPDFTTAGPHWNPAARQHGLENPAGSHRGDLPNLEVDSSGHGLLLFGIDGSGIRGGPTPLLDADGASIVIHAQADDERTDPSGNSGARIACGVIG